MMNKVLVYQKHQFVSYGDTDAHIEKDLIRKVRKEIYTSDRVDLRKGRKAKTGIAYVHQRLQELQTLLQYIYHLMLQDTTACI